MRYPGVARRRGVGAQRAAPPTESPPDIHQSCRNPVDSPPALWLSDWRRDPFSPPCLPAGRRRTAAERAEEPMEEAALALILDKCLEAINDGSSIEAAADRYPSLKHEILPLLEIADMLSEGTVFAQDELTPELRRLKVRLLESPV